MKYGQECPELQRLAIRILSQPCSGSSKYQLKKNMAEKLLSYNGRNQIEKQRLSDWTFVHYNLHLYSFKENSADDKSISKMDQIDQDWIVDNSQAVPSPSRDLMDLGHSNPCLRSRFKIVVIFHVL